MIKKIIQKYQSDQKKRIVVNIIVGAFVIRGLALVVSLFTLPAYIRYFNNQSILGLWFTILSVLSWVLTFDLGIGNGLRNELVHATQVNDKDNVKQLVSSAYLSTQPLLLLFPLLVFCKFR